MCRKKEIFTGRFTVTSTSSQRCESAKIPQIRFIYARQKILSTWRACSKMRGGRARENNYMRTLPKMWSAFCLVDIHAIREIFHKIIPHNMLKLPSKEWIKSASKPVAGNIFLVSSSLFYVYWNISVACCWVSIWTQRNFTSLQTAEEILVKIFCWQPYLAWHAANAAIQLNLFSFTGINSKSMLNGTKTRNKYPNVKSTVSNLLKRHLLNCQTYGKKRCLKVEARNDG